MNVSHEQKETKKIGDISGYGSHLPSCKLLPDLGKYKCDENCATSPYLNVPEYIPGHFLVYDSSKSSSNQSCAWCQLRRQNIKICEIYKCSACRKIDSIVYLHDCLYI